MLLMSKGLTNNQTFYLRLKDILKQYNLSEHLINNPISILKSLDDIEKKMKSKYNDFWLNAINNSEKMTFFRCFQIDNSKPEFYLNEIRHHDYIGNTFLNCV